MEKTKEKFKEHECFQIQIMVCQILMRKIVLYWKLTGKPATIFDRLILDRQL